MAEAVAEKTVLSDSHFRTRPHFNTLLMSDANAKGNSVKQIEEKRLIRHMKFPSLVGRKDVDSIQDLNQGLTNPTFKRWNDEGDFRANAPYRSCDNILDPVSGFVSVAGDVDRCTGHTKIAPLVQIPTTVHSSTPQAIHSIRANYATAPPETKRMRDTDPGTPYLWNSRKVSDASLRASLGGWTSDKDPRKLEEERLRGERPKTPADESKETRDKLALKFVYTSSAQRSYGEVPWDNMLAPKRWPHTTTLEDRPDMISQKWTLKRYDPAAREWQRPGRSWDWFQNRRGYYKTSPIPGIVFCSPCPRQEQIPLYSGSIGAENLDEIDNAAIPLQPLTIKRVNIPRSTDTAHRPNIPHYTGCTLYRSDRPLEAHSTMTPPEPVTTARVHRSLPITPNSSEFKRDSQMSKMVTLVPPCNPFKNSNREVITV